METYTKLKGARLKGWVCYEVVWTMMWSGKRWSGSPSGLEAYYDVVG